MIPNLDLGVQLTVSYLFLSTGPEITELSPRERMLISGCIAGFFFELISHQTGIRPERMVDAVAESGPANVNDVRRLYMQLH